MFLIFTYKEPFLSKMEKKMNVESDDSGVVDNLKFINRMLKQIS